MTNESSTRVMDKRNELLERASSMSENADEFHINNWEIRSNDGQVNIVFGFEPDWEIDNICIANMKVHAHDHKERHICLNVFHDGGMDKIIFNLADLTQPECDYIYGVWVDNNLHFIVLFADKNGDEAYFRIPTTIEFSHS